MSIHAPAPAVVDESLSQVVKAQLQLREMLLAGELPAGERIAEVSIAERLGISRTPIREALMRLEQEGLLESIAGAFSPKWMWPMPSSYAALWRAWWLDWPPSGVCRMG